MPARWWRYQAERFPLAQHGPLVAVFSYSAVCYSRLLRSGPEAAFTLPGVAAAATAFVCCLGFFAQLRIADEHKDFAEDARWRPYRPVPRGLVTLRGLTFVGLAIAVVQAGLAAALTPRLLMLLAITWVYLALMTREFFVRAWLERRPLAYMLSHMLIMPLIDLFATGCDWMPAGAAPPGRGLALFLAASYMNGVVIEVGRKIRTPEDEEAGVRTYSVVWGRRRSLIAWLGAMAAAAGLGVAAAAETGHGVLMLGFGAAAWLAALAVAARFLGRLGAGAGKGIEVVSGLWVIVFYLGLGIVPAVLQVLR
jgi:4-hydroxybenzoate polyprenyltransferase